MEKNIILINKNNIDILNTIFCKTKISKLFNLDELGNFVFIRGFLNYINIHKKISFLSAFAVPIRYLVLGFISIIIKIFNKTEKSNLRTEILIINLGSIINRLKELKNIYLRKYNVQEVHINNKFIFSKQKYNNNILYPKIPSFKVLMDLLKLYTLGTLEYYFIFRKKLDYKIDYTIFIDYFSKQLIHKDWADREYKRIIKIYNAKYYLFDQDGYGQSMFLAYNLKINGYITIQLQHGIMTNPIYYIPLCEYIFCCSEREKKSLIKYGIKEENIFVIGAPFQNLLENDFNNNIIKSIFSDYLVLASSEFFYTNDYINMIKKSKILNKSKNKCLRLRPGDNKSDKMKWKSELKDFKIKEGLSISDEIFNAEIIITFSYDALIKCLLMKKKVITCIHPDNKYNENYSFLFDIDFLFIATNAEELDEMILRITNISDNKYLDMISNDKLEYFFGSYDENKIIERINFGFSKISEEKNIFEIYDDKNNKRNEYLNISLRNENIY